MIGPSQMRGIPKPIRDAKLPVDHFGIVATASITLPAGRWALTTRSDDGIRVWVDEREVIDAWTTHHARYEEGVFRITHRRKVTLRVEYFELDGAAMLLVELHPAR